MTNQNDKKLVEQIKNNYIEKPQEKTKLEELKTLDSRVKTPAKVFAYVFGSVGTLVLGTGMCLAMKIIANLMPLGIVIGLLGIGMVSTTYPLYQLVLNKRKAKYGEEIIAKSNELLND